MQGFQQSTAKDHEIIASMIVNPVGLYPCFYVSYRLTVIISYQSIDNLNASGSSGWSQPSISGWWQANKNRAIDGISQFIYQCAS
jgi:hypothetical protein